MLVNAANQTKLKFVEPQTLLETGWPIGARLPRLPTAAIPSVTADISTVLLLRSLNPNYPFFQVNLKKRYRVE